MLKGPEGEGAGDPTAPITGEKKPEGDPLGNLDVKSAKTGDGPAGAAGTKCNCSGSCSTKWPFC